MITKPQPVRVVKRMIVKPKSHSSHIITNYQPPTIVGRAPRLSICITSHNDNEELAKTIQSARETAPCVHEIVVVDDASKEPFNPPPGIVFHRSPERMGVGPSRDWAVALSTGDYVLLTDSHMRFETGWYENIMTRLGDPKVAWCGSCLGLSPDNMDLAKFNGAYYGAKTVFFDKTKDETVLFEGKWVGDLAGKDDYEISCMMGACYFIHRDTYHHVGGLGILKMWGSDEPYLSTKLWLAGCELRLAKTVRIGHQFRTKSPYTVKMWNLVYNKLRATKELLGDSAYASFREHFPKDVNTRDAIMHIRADWQAIERDRERNGKVFTRSLDWYCERFNLKNPLKNASLNPAVRI